MDIGLATGHPIECKHGLEPDWRSSCKDQAAGKNLNKERDPQKLLKAFTASYPGECPECENPIRVGDTIARYDDERYRHDPLCRPGAKSTIGPGGDFSSIESWAEDATSKGGGHGVVVDGVDEATAPPITEEWL